MSQSSHKTNKVQIDFSEQHLKLMQSVVTNTSDAVVITEAEPIDGLGPRIIYVNAAFSRMTGYTEEDVIGKTPRILQGPKSDKVALKRMKEAMSKWEPCEISTVNYKKNGEEFWINISINPVADAKGWYTHWIAIEKDISHQKNEEIQKEIQIQIAQYFKEGQYLKDTLIKVLRFLAEIGEYDLAEIWLNSREKQTLHLAEYFTSSKLERKFYGVGKQIEQVIKGDGLPGMVFEKREPVIFENLPENAAFLRKEAAEKSGLNSALGIPIFHFDQVVGVLILVGTKLKLKENSQIKPFVKLGAFIGAELVRKRQEEEMLLLFESAPEIMAIVSPDGHFIKVNPAFCRILGYSYEELAYQPFEKFVHPHDLISTRTEYQETITGERQANNFINRYRTKSGVYKWISWSSSDVFGEAGYVFAYGRDVSEVVELQNLLSNASSLAKVGGWEVDFVNDALYWSPMTKTIHEVDEKYTPDLKRAFAFYREDVRDVMERIIQQCIDTGKSFDVEMPIITARGNSKWIRAIGMSEFIEGACVRIYGSIQDIDERKQIEQEMQRILQEKNTILESIGDAFFAMDKNWTITYWNKHAEQLIGMDRNQTLGHAFAELFPLAMNLKFYSEYKKSLLSGETAHFEEFYPVTGHWYEVSAYPSEQGLSVYFKDISKRKKSEDEIRQSNERFEKVTEATNDAIWDYDLKQNTLFWGKGFTSLFLYDLKDLQPGFEFFMDKIHPDDREEILIKIESTILNPDVLNWYEEYRFLKADGSYAYVIDRAIIIRDHAKQAIRLVGAMTDITYRKEYESSLKLLNENLELRAKELAISNAELEQFAFVASHDLQEPLRMVTSFLSQLEKKYGNLLDEKAHQYIHFAVDGAKRMRQIILDLLDFSRIGRDEDEMQTFSLKDVVDEVVQLQKKLIMEKKGVISYDALPSIHSYRFPMIQVFQNLISNALKYSKKDPAPIIEIKSEDKGTHFLISVKDNGIGINPEYFDKIFIIFQRLHAREEYGGTGMGLAIVKKIIERMGGEIWVESERNIGTTFYFTLPKA